MLKIGSNISEVRIDGDLDALRRDLDAFVEFGLTAAEIGVHGTDVIRNARLIPQRLAEVIGILKDYPLSYSVHAPNPLNLMDEDFALHQQLLRASLEFTSAIGSDLLVYHPGRFQAEETFGPLGKLDIPPNRQQQMLDLEAETLRKLAEDYVHVTIAMENARPYKFHSPYCYAERIDLLKQQVEAIDRPNVGINLDFGHLHMASKFYAFAELEAVKSIAGKIRHCHVHDNFGGSVYHTEKQQTHQIPLGKGDSHMPVGWGDIDFAGIFSCFLADYTGLLIVELRGRYFAQTGESATNLEALLRNLKTSP